MRVRSKQDTTYIDLDMVVIRKSFEISLPGLHIFNHRDWPLAIGVRSIEGSYPSPLR